MLLRFQILDSSSGELLRSYAPSKELEGKDGCFVGNQFVFIGGQDDKSELEFAPAN